MNEQDSEVLFQFGANEEKQEVDTSLKAYLKQ